MPTIEIIVEKFTFTSPSKKFIQYLCIAMALKETFPFQKLPWDFTCHRNGRRAFHADLLKTYRGYNELFIKKRDRYNTTKQCVIKQNKDY